MGGGLNCVCKQVCIGIINKLQSKLNCCNVHPKNGLALHEFLCLTIPVV